MSQRWSSPRARRSGTAATASVGAERGAGTQGWRGREPSAGVLRGSTLTLPGLQGFLPPCLLSPFYFWATGSGQAAWSASTEGGAGRKGSLGSESAPPWPHCHPFSWVPEAWQALSHVDPRQGRSWKGEDRAGPHVSANCPWGRQAGLHPYFELTLRTRSQCGFFPYLPALNTSHQPPQCLEPVATLLASPRGCRFYPQPPQGLSATRTTPHPSSCSLWRGVLTSLWKEWNFSKAEATFLIAHLGD